MDQRKKKVCYCFCYGLLTISSILLAYSQENSTTSSISSLSTDSDAVGKVSDNYVIQPSDIIVFKVVGEPDIDTELRVSADGIVFLPWIGDIHLQGKTVREARQSIYTLYDQDYLVNPQVQLLVTYFSENRVQVLGQVGRQGDVVIPPEETLSLLQAIARAKGWTRLSNKRRVGLQRVMPNGTIKEYMIDAGKISVKDWQLQKGDVITIPEIIL